MKNKGIKIGVVFLLLFALLSVAGCQYDDVVIDTDPTFTYVNFDEDDDILPASTRVSILIPYTLEPGNYKVTAVTGSVKYPSSSGTSVKDLSLARDGDGLNITFTIAAPELTPTPEPTATPTVEPTATPTAEPTATPTAEPTATPTAEPTATPTAEPTATPTAEPTATPTAVPTAVPTATPSPTNHPKTGDDFAPALWLTLCAGSLAALALLLKKRHI